MAKLLLIEDDVNLQEANRDLLEEQGHSITLAMRLSEAREWLAAETPDLIVLDVMLPDGNGFDFLVELRETSRVPVIMLTAMGAMEDKEQGYDAGADDYLPKPYKGKELVLRVNAILKRAEDVPEKITRGFLTLKPMPREAFVNGVNILLTPSEYKILQFFVQHEGRLMSAAFLYESLWGQPMGRNSQAIRTAVSRLRSKLTGSGYNIASNVHNDGYFFEKEK